MILFAMELAGYMRGFLPSLTANRHISALPLKASSLPDCPIIHNLIFL
jgi:hypothetical protein